MQVEPLVPDVPAPRGPHPAPLANDDLAAGGGSVTAGGAGQAFARLVDAAGSILAGADRAEGAFVAHRGGLQEMVVERARADVALQIAASAAQRTAQALATLLGMQV